MIDARAAIARYYGGRRTPPKTYSRARIFARWRGCCYCDGPAEVLDHIDPISRGGADAAGNLVPACSACNASKGALTLSEWASTF
ncbi:HNH endonuclease [Kitasatospora cathayae]|uniref:HNH endonuclease n=1 Tax=Kitasatospora cathayae TaxID=3004092 RepID=UPI0038601F66